MNKFENVDVFASLEAVITTKRTVTTYTEGLRHS